MLLVVIGLLHISQRRFLYQNTVLFIGARFLTTLFSGPQFFPRKDGLWTPFIIAAQLVYRVRVHTFLLIKNGENFPLALKTKYTTTYSLIFIITFRI